MTGWQVGDFVIMVHDGTRWVYYIQDLDLVNHQTRGVFLGYLTHPIPPTFTKIGSDMAYPFSILNQVGARLATEEEKQLAIRNGIVAGILV